MLRAGFEVGSGLVGASSCGIEGSVVAGCVIAVAVVVMLRCGDVVDLVAEDGSDDSAWGGGRKMHALVIYYLKSKGGFCDAWSGL